MSSGSCRYSLIPLRFTGLPGGEGDRRDRRTDAPRAIRPEQIGGIAVDAEACLIDMRAQAEVPSALRTDTPTLVALADVIGARNRSRQTRDNPLAVRRYAVRLLRVTARSCSRTAYLGKQSRKASVCPGSSVA